jgi:hypothetical protein
VKPLVISKHSRAIDDDGKSIDVSLAPAQRACEFHRFEAPAKELEPHAECV